MSVFDASLADVAPVPVEDGVVLDERLLGVVDGLFERWVGSLRRSVLDVVGAEVLVGEVLVERGVAELYGDEPRLLLACRKLVWLFDLFPDLEGLNS